MIDDEISKKKQSRNNRKKPNTSRWAETEQKQQILQELTNITICNNTIKKKKNDRTTNDTT